MKKYNYFLFDLDGTLINTIDLIINCFRYSITELCGIELSDSEIINNIGLPLTAQFKVYLKDKSKNFDLNAIGEKHMEYQIKHWKNYIHIYDGVLELLDDLKINKKKSAIVTSRRITTTTLYTDKLGLAPYFQAVVTPEDTETHKPDAAPAFKGLEKLNAPPEETIFIGDSEFDLKCAENAGIDSYLVTWKESEKKDLTTKPTYDQPDFKLLHDLF